MNDTCPECNNPIPIHSTGDRRCIHEIGEYTVIYCIGNVSGDTWINVWKGMKGVAFLNDQWYRVSEARIYALDLLK
jgi:hypothetical protein